ncbi:MAG: hypothetical protein BMS9Abin10_0703 [Gammaproteobacteria bacterium]|nr:MAG: hypothetical protein BMS9Abin10_0703 [Gammaproteobacteria bacterium]
MNRIGLMLIIAPLLVVGIHYGSEMAVVNQCVDAGGSFNYSTMTCSFTESTKYIPYSQRYRWSVNIAVGVSFLGLLVTLVGGQRQRAAGLGARDRGTGVRSRALN